MKISLDFPGKCYDGDRTYDVGTYYSKTDCMKMECAKDFSMTFMGCGSVQPPEGFVNIPDLSKQYPDCCTNIVRIEDFENIIE